MKKELNLEELVYTESGLYLSNCKLENTNQDLIDKECVINFILKLNELNYEITNVIDLFNLSLNNFEKLEKELIEFLSSFEVEGIVLSKSFAKSTILENYTLEDRWAIFAHSSIVYGYEKFYESFGRGPATKVLEEYYKATNKEVFKLKNNLRKIEISFDKDFDLRKIAKKYLESKIVLRDINIEILKKMNVDLLIEIFNDSTILIKETEILFLSILIEKKNNIFNTILNINNVKNIDQIARILLYKYSYIKEDGVIDFYGEIKDMSKATLSKIILKIPTRIRKQILRELNNVKNINLIVEQMFKYHSFWKKILKNLSWESQEKTAKKYPIFIKLKDALYKNDRSNTFNGTIEKAKQEGDYEKAFKILIKNNGFMLRNLMEYLRNVKGVSLAKKQKVDNKRKENIDQRNDDLQESLNKRNLSSFINKNNKSLKRIDIKKDAVEYIDSKEFIKELEKSNPKILWKIYELLNDTKNLESKTEKRYITTNVVYDKKLPAINEELAKKVKKNIKKTIRKIKRKENESLKKVYIDDSLKNFNLDYSGRNNKTVSLTGEYLSAGSKIDISEYIGENKILRLGIAWRGNSSCDIDHSVNLLNEEKVVYYGSPVYEKNNKILIKSSGDVQSNDENIFSVELVDIDIDGLIDNSISELLSSIIQYSGKTLDNYQVLFFMNIIDKKDRIIDSNKVSFKVDQMQYAIQIHKKTRNIVGFYVNLEKSEIEVLCQEISSNDNLYNAEISKNVYKKIIENKPKRISIFKALKEVINKEQLVSNKEDADLIITCLEEKNKQVLRPQKNLEDIQKIIF